MFTKSTMRKLAIAGVLCGVSFLANATTTNLGVISGTSSFSYNLPRGSFSGDTVTFELASDSSLNFNVSSTGMGSSPTYSLTGGSLTSPLTGDKNTGYVTPTLGDGLYTLTLSGSVSARNGGTITFSYGVTPVTPVPEPEAIAMMLAGLGVIAAVARRRKSVAQPKLGGTVLA